MASGKTTNELTFAEALAEVDRLRGAVKDLTAERDAAAENARRERDRRGTYDGHTITTAALTLRLAIRDLGTEKLGAMIGEDKHRTIVERIFRNIGLRSVDEQRPVVRVVTSPRFYSEEQREKAARAFHDDALGASDQPFDAPHPFTDTTQEWCFEVVDCVAEALGMRRAADQTPLQVSRTPLQGHTPLQGAASDTATGVRS